MLNYIIDISFMCVYVQYVIFWIIFFAIFISVLFEKNS